MLKKIILFIFKENSLVNSIKLFYAFFIANFSLLPFYSTQIILKITKKKCIYLYIIHTDEDNKEKKDEQSMWMCDEA